MSELVRRLRVRALAIKAKLKPSKFDGYDASLDEDSADRIEQLERELRECRIQALMDAGQIQTAYEELAAEKALADEMYRDYPYADDAYYAYRKARGL